MVSKGYVLIGEQPDGSVTELESRDLTTYESWRKKDLCARFTMKQHLRVMSSMIQELKSVGNNLTEEQ